MKVFALLFVLSLDYFVNCSDLVAKRKIVSRLMWLKLKNIWFTADWLISCAQSDPNFKQCHLESVRGLFQTVLRGEYKVEGIDSTDPVYLEKIQILQGSGNGPVSVDISMSKLKIGGLTKTEVIDNQIDLNTYSWTTTLAIPKLRVEGDYQMRGQILVIPLNVSWVSESQVRYEYVSNINYL